MPPRYSMVHRVEFSDTDMAGIIHFSSFFRYMEVTEHAFLRSLGFSVVMELEGRKYGWPRVHVECDFKRPALFEDEVAVDLVVKEVRDHSIRYDFDFRLLGREGEGPIALGSFVVVCVTWDDVEGHMVKVPIPSTLASKLRNE